MRLVVNRSQEQRKREEPPTPRGDARRPALTVIQGGQPRRRRAGLVAAGPRGTTAAPRLEPELQIEDVPIYLRPIPAWVPRLW